MNNMNVIPTNPSKRKNVKCICCNTTIVKVQAEIDSYKKEGKQHFCSLDCIDKYNKVLIEKYKKDCQKFDYILSTVDKPGKGVDVLYLNTLWEEQTGKCGFTKIDMILPASSAEVTNSMVAAKLIRINKSSGFIKGNVMFICTGISYITDKYSNEETIKFINLIKTTF